MKEGIFEKLEQNGRLDGDEALAFVACAFSNATNNNYPPEAMLKRTVLGVKYRVIVEAIR